MYLCLLLSCLTISPNILQLKFYDLINMQQILFEYLSIICYVKVTVLGDKMSVTKVHMTSCLEAKTLVEGKARMQRTVIKALNCRFGSNQAVLKFREGIRKYIMQSMAFV